MDPAMTGERQNLTRLRARIKVTSGLVKLGLSPVMCHLVEDLDVGEPPRCSRLPAAPMATARMADRAGSANASGIRPGMVGTAADTVKAKTRKNGPGGIHRNDDDRH